MNNRARVVVVLRGAWGSRKTLSCSSEATPHVYHALSAVRVDFVMCHFEECGMCGDL